MSNKYVYKQEDADKFNKHGIDLTVFQEGVESANVVAVDVEEGHFQEFKDKESTYMYYIFEGKGTFVIDGGKYEVSKGDLVVIPPMTKIHYFGNMRMSLTVTPAFKEENEVHVRYVDKGESPYEKPDSKEELLDLVDENDTVIGKITKKHAHTNSAFIHRVVLVYLFNEKGEFLMQKRSETKKNYPGWWIESAGGHVSAGEDPKNAASREIFEELGITMDHKNLQFLKKELRIDGNDAQFYYVYFTKYDGNDFTLQENEVEEVRWISYSELDNLLSDSGQLKYKDKFINYSVIPELLEKIL